MYAKFIGSKKGGGTGAINYLLDDVRVKNGTAKILKGDSILTTKLIKSLSDKKQKVTFGVLSFEEKADFLTSEQKQKIMADFEKTLFPKMSESQYNILWVEHSDKNRLELNFVIPKVELSTQKALNPYFHKADFSRVDMFEDISNIKYNLSSKKDPAKKQTLTFQSNLKRCPQDYKKLDKEIHQLVESRHLKSRTEIIEHLRKQDIEVRRINENGFTAKLPNQKKAKRFKGEIYLEKYKDDYHLMIIKSDRRDEAEKFANRDTAKELEELESRLTKYNDKKAKALEKLYPYKEPQVREIEPYRPNIEHKKEEQTNDTIRTDVGRRNSEKRSIIESHQATRNGLFESIEKRRKILYKSNGSTEPSNSKPRESIYQQLRKNRESVYDQLRTDSYESYFEHTGDGARVSKKVIDNMPKWRKNRSHRKRFNQKIDEFGTKFRNHRKRFNDKIDEFGTKIGKNIDRITSKIDEFTNLIRAKKEGTYCELDFDTSNLVDDIRELKPKFNKDEWDDFMSDIKKENNITNNNMKIRF